MAILNRLSRLFKADMHAVLDRVEEPELVLQQALREMTAAVAVDEQRLAALDHEEHALNEQLSALTSSQASLSAELDLCLAAGKDELARDLVRRRLVGEHTEIALNQHLSGLRREAANIREKLTTQRNELLSLQAQVQRIAPRVCNPPLHPTLNTIRDEEIEIALLREKQARGLL